MQQQQHTTDYLSSSTTSKSSIYSQSCQLSSLKVVARLCAWVFGGSESKFSAKLPLFIEGFPRDVVKIIGLPTVFVREAGTRLRRSTICCSSAWLSVVCASSASAWSTAGAPQAAGESCSSAGCSHTPSIIPFSTMDPSSRTKTSPSRWEWHKNCLFCFSVWRSWLLPLSGADLRSCFSYRRHTTGGSVLKRTDTWIFHIWRETAPNYLVCCHFYKNLFEACSHIPLLELNVDATQQRVMNNCYPLRGNNTNNGRKEHGLASRVFFLRHAPAVTRKASGKVDMMQLKGDKMKRGFEHCWKRIVCNIGEVAFRQFKWRIVTYHPCNVCR